MLTACGQWTMSPLGSLDVTLTPPESGVSGHKMDSKLPTTSNQGPSTLLSKGEPRP